MKESQLMRKLHNGDKEAAGLIIERYYAGKFFKIYQIWNFLLSSKPQRISFDDCKKPLF